MGSTWRVVEEAAEGAHPRRSDRTQPVIYSLWHRALLIQSFLQRDVGACVGISEHADGELAAQTCHRLGYRTARGSSTRGGSRLLRELLRFAKEGTGDMALTPDGPKGPPEEVKEGVLYLAARVGWPIVPTGAWARPQKVLGSWDRFLVPAPFAKVASVFGEPMHLPRRPSETQLEEAKQELTQRMHAVQIRARELL